MTKKVVRFKCEYCGRLFAREHNAIWHETNRCLRNPALCACLSCNNFHSKLTGTPETNFVETSPCCSAMNCAWSKDCNDWEERERGWEFEIPRAIPACFLSKNSRD